MLLIDLQYFPSSNYINALCKDSGIDFCPYLPFRRSSFRNRMVVAASSGPIVLSIPIVGSRSNSLPYNQIEIDNRSSWQHNHFRTLVTSYNNSPYFIHYRDELEAIYSTKTALLYDWNLKCLTWLLAKIKLRDRLILSDHRLSGQTEVNRLSDHFTQVRLLRCRLLSPILRFLRTALDFFPTFPW